MAGARADRATENQRDRRRYSARTDSAARVSSSSSPPVVSLVDLLLQLIGQALQVVNVNLTVCEPLPLVSLVVPSSEVPGSCGAGCYEPFDSLFVSPFDFLLLLLLVGVGLQREYISSSFSTPYWF